MGMAEPWRPRKRDSADWRLVWAVRMSRVGVVLVLGGKGVVVVVVVVGVGFSVVVRERWR